MGGHITHMVNVEILIEFHQQVTNEAIFAVNALAMICYKVILRSCIKSLMRFIESLENMTQ